MKITTISALCAAFAATVLLSSDAKAQFDISRYFGRDWQNQSGFLHPPPQRAGHQQPGYQQPDYQQPGYQQPGYQQPGYQQPGYQQPDYPSGGVNSGSQQPAPGPGSQQQGTPNYGAHPPNLGVTSISGRGVFTRNPWTVERTTNQNGQTGWVYRYKGWLTGKDREIFVPSN